jgi:hypothetical protein
MSSDATTLPDVPAIAPRHAAALIVGATLAFVGAALTIGALFPDYWDPPPLALVDQTGPLAQTVVFALALLVAGALLLGARAAPVGAAMLVVVVAVGAEPRVVDAVRLSEADGPKAGTGYALVSAGYVLALVSAIIGALVTLRPRAWAFRGGARFLGALAALAGFGAAVGYGMNPFEVDTGRTDVSYGSPLDPVPRQLWAALLVVVVLSVVPALAIAVGGRLGTGLTLGLLFAIGGIAALRVGTIFGTVGGRDVGVTGAEGTWAFLAAGGAVLIMTFAGLAAGASRTPRVATRPTVSSTPPPDEPAPIAGDEPGAIIEVPAASDGAPSDEETTATRIDPMPAATVGARPEDDDEDEDEDERTIQ